jgi:predicted PurR-regulated permease PerM
MLERLSPARRNLALLVVAALFAWFAWHIRSVLNPLLVGYLAAFVAHPLVVRIERRGYSRRTAVNLTFAAGFLVATALSLGIFFQVRALALDVYQSATVGETLEGEEEPAEPSPAFRERLQARLDEFSASLQKLGIDLGPLSLKDLPRLLQEHGGEAAGVGLSAAGQGFRFLWRFVGKGVALGAFLILVPLYAYYFLFELGRLHGFVARHFPRRDRARIQRVGGRIGQVVASFFRGRLSVAFFKGIFLSIGLWVLGIDYALFFGMTTGLLSIVPFLGSFAGFVLALIFGVIEHGVVGSLWRTGVVFALGEIVEGYVLIPKILGDELGLHPMVVIASILAGGAAFGMLGVLVALPVVASVVIIVEEFVLPALRAYAEEGPGELPPEGT